MKNYLGFQTRRTPRGGFSRGFLLLFALLLMPSLALWGFYRWLFANDTHLLVVPFLAVMTAWIWAYLIGYGAENHLDND